MSQPASPGRRGRQGIRGGWGGARRVRGLGSPGPAAPGTGFLRSAPWTMHAASWGASPRCAYNTPGWFWDPPLVPPHQVGSPAAPRPLEGLELVLGGGGGRGSVFLTGHRGARARSSRCGHFPGPPHRGSASAGHPRGVRTERGQQVPGSFPPRLREQPGRPQSPAGPPRWHLRARGSTAGQNRNFLGPSGRLRERGEDGHDPQSPPPAWCGLQLPACSTKPEAYNARRTPGVYGLRLQLPACSAELRLTTPY